MFKYTILAVFVLFSPSAFSVQCGVGNIIYISDTVLPADAGDYDKFTIAINYSVAPPNAEGAGQGENDNILQRMITVNTNPIGFERFNNLKHIAQLAYATGSVVELWSHKTAPPYLASVLCAYIDEITIFRK